MFWAAPVTITTRSFRRMTVPPRRSVTLPGGNRLARLPLRLVVDVDVVVDHHDQLDVLVEPEEQRGGLLGLALQPLAHRDVAVEVGARLRIVERRDVGQRLPQAS